VRQQEEPIELQ
jgi:hypothetical protein